MILAQESPDALIVNRWRVDMVQDRSVALTQRVEVHDRNNISRAIDVVAGDFIEQPMLARQTLIKFSAGRRLQQADHRRDNAAALNEIDLALEDRRRIVIKTDNKAALHVKAGALDALHISDQIALHILLLAAFGQAGIVRGLDADEH